MFPQTLLRPFLYAYLVLFACGVPQGQGFVAGKAPSEAVSYYQDIRPILQANCQGCHQPAKNKGGYVMTNFQKLLAGGEKDGVAIIPGNVAKGALLDQITPVNGSAEMPKNKPPLPEHEVALIRRWIGEGALDDTPADAKAHFDAEHPPQYARLPVVSSLDFSPDGALLAVKRHTDLVRLAEEPVQFCSPRCVSHNRLPFRAAYPSSGRRRLP